MSLSAYEAAASGSVTASMISCGRLPNPAALAAIKVLCCAAGLHMAGEVMMNLILRVSNVPAETRFRASMVSA